MSKHGALNRLQAVVASSGKRLGDDLALSRSTRLKSSQGGHVALQYDDSTAGQSLSAAASTAESSSSSALGATLPSRSRETPHSLAQSSNSSATGPTSPSRREPTHSSSSSAIEPTSPGRREPTHVLSSSAAATTSPGRREPTHESKALSSSSAAAAASSSASSASSSASAAPPLPPWKIHLANVEEMRARRDAPVDTMGCEQCADPSAPPPVQRFQILLSLMLSSQTKDEVTWAAMQRLVKHGCTPEAIAATPLPTLETLLCPVGFYRNKAKYLVEVSNTLLEKHGGDIPRTMEGLLSLKGVGPKMANLAMSSAWGDQQGLGVDVHMHRITNRLGWVRTSSPEATRTELESWLPREHWPSLNLLLVGFGQQVCQDKNPQCSVCLNAPSCPSAVKGGGKPKKGK